MSWSFRTLVKRTVEQTVTNLTYPGTPPVGISASSLDRSRSMQQAAVYACVRLRAETGGALPVGVVTYDGPARHPAADPQWLVKPNPETTRFELVERTLASLDVDGNAFWFKVKDNLGRVIEVWPLPPSSVTVFRDKETNERRYRIGAETFDRSEVLHIPGFSLAGRLRGLSPIAEHAHAIGLAIAAEEFGEMYFVNGSQMTGVIESTNDPGPVGVDRMRATFEKDHRGLRNAHRPGFLFGGATWKQLSIPNDAAQFLETRKYQVTEIARIFRVPPHKIGDLERATFSNIEHQAIEWVQDGMIPYTSRIEHAVAADGDLIDDGQHLRFNYAGLLRGDTKTMYEAFAIARNWGWLNVDDIRAFIDMNPLPNGLGQTYLEPLNMIGAGQREAIDASSTDAPKGLKIGARNSRSDQELIQSVYDAVSELGAACPVEPEEA